MYEGIPQRTWRGKLVEVLRGVNGIGTITLLKAGKAIKSDFQKSELPWLALIVSQLEKDGIVAVRKSSKSLHLSLAQE